MNMIRRMALILALVASSGILASCATPAAPAKMAPTSEVIPHAAADSPLRRAIFIRNVGGGEKTNPLTWSKVGNEELREALHRSLDRYEYLSTSQNDNRYALDAFLIKLKQPEQGITMIVDSHIRYQLIRLADDSVLYDDIITASYAGTISDAFIGPNRMKIATQGSVLSNITNFLLKLQSIPQTNR